MKDSTPVFRATASSLDVDDLPEVMATGGDWEDVLSEIEKLSNERIVLNLGPVHPSTHGVLRVILEIDGETVREARLNTGYLHTGIEKNMEFRSWTQGVTFCTRMDYVAPLFNEAVYVHAVEQLLGIEDDVPQRANWIRILLMELNRIGSHLVAIGSGGNELGATTMMTISFREREEILRILERITGLRMNHAFMRPGGVAQDIPEGTTDYIRELLPKIRKGIGELQDLTQENPIFKLRHIDVGYMSLASMMALGMTGPCLRAAGLPLDLRKDRPYFGYDQLEFDVPVRDQSDAYNRVQVRFDECYQSLRIINQVLDLLDASEGEPVMVQDPAIKWPAQLSVSADGQGNSLEHIREIMGQSMESLIHHFKLVTEGFKVPPGQAYGMIEHAKGVIGCHVVSDGGTRPYRAHFRDPSFSNLQSFAMMTEGGQLADVVVSLASIDPVLGGVDR